MRALLRYIIEDKRVYARVLEEIDEAFESRGSSTAFSYAEGCTLEYFQACLKEALRLHPAVQMILPLSGSDGGSRSLWSFPASR